MAREAGSELLLLSWNEAEARPPEVVAEEAYAAIDEACRSRGSAPLQERVFGDLSAAPALARGRARALFLHEPADESAVFRNHDHRNFNGAGRKND
jgi:hypothetical protein